MDKGAANRARMGSFRRLVRGNLLVAWLLVLLGLAMKLVVPFGYMPVFSASGITITVCNGMTPTTMTMPGMDHGAKGSHDAPAKSDAPCAFAGLGAPGLGGADIVQLAIALAVIVAAGVMVAAVLRVVLRARLRPPLRGPPVRG